MFIKSKKNKKIKKPSAYVLPLYLWECSLQCSFNCETECSLIYQLLLYVVMISK